MKLFLSLLLLCGSAIGQTKEGSPTKSRPFHVLIEGELIRAAQTRVLSPEEMDLLLERGKYILLPTCLKPSDDGCPVPQDLTERFNDLLLLQFKMRAAKADSDRIAALEKQVANLTADHAQSARDREYYGFLFFFSHPELFPSSDESGPCDWTQGTTRDACTAAYKDAQYALTLEKRVKELEETALICQRQPAEASGSINCTTLAIEKMNAEPRKQWIHILPSEVKK